MAVEPTTDVPRGVLPPVSESPSSRDARRRRAQLKRNERWARRIERYETRRAGPPPPRHLHRAVITVLMLLLMLGLLYLLVTAPATPPAA